MAGTRFDEKGSLGGLGGFAVQDLILTTRFAQDAKIAKKDHLSNRVNDIENNRTFCNVILRFAKYFDPAGSS